MIWYKAHWNDIRPIDIERETKECVYIKGRRHNKISDYDSYFPTREEAKAYLIKKAQYEVDKHKIWLRDAEETLAKVKAL